MCVAPCKGCKDRHNLCHSHCSGYLNYKKQLADEKARIRSRKVIDHALSELDHHRATTRKRDNK